MRWKSGRRSSNVEDRRGQSSASPLLGGGMGLTVLLRFLPRLLRSKLGRYVLGLGALVVVGGKFLGVDVVPLLTGGGGGTSSNHLSADEKQLSEFVSVVLADTEVTWHELFRRIGKRYQEPRLVLFSQSVSSACGKAQSAMGPFYCPADKKVYIDLSFYRDLKQRHQAPGDFAQAYVIAHEVGHHVQTLLGISQRVHEMKQRASKSEANLLSVRQELQADCFAGLWAHAANVQRSLLESGDLKEALVAAAAIGDDRLQKQSKGFVVPESFTHGSSEQRVGWFQRGFKSGAISDCDTFNVSHL